MKEVAVGIILRDGHVLACQRQRDAKYALKWEFPGGKVETGETPRQALKRELHEELAIDVTVANEFHRQEWIYTEGTDNPKRDGAFRVHYYLIREFEGEMENRAFEQICWIRPDELKSMDILEGNREPVERLVNHAKDR